MVGIMEITIDSRDELHIVSITGNLDNKTAREAQDRIMPVLTEECCLVFDLSGCDMISSAGLRILLMFAKQIKKQRGRGVISGLTEEVEDVMELTGFSNIFKAYISVDEAVAALGKGTL
jgi:anti-sigma B factor antagonist